MSFLNRIGSGATSKFGFRMGFRPGAPTSVTASLPNTYGNTTATVSWTAPLTVGAPALHDYLIQYSSDNGVNYTTFADAVSNATTVTVTGLTNGYAYVFRVAAINYIGTSDFSAASNSVTPLNSKIPTPLFTMDDNTQGRVGIDFSNYLSPIDQSYVANPSGGYFYNYFDCMNGLCPDDTFGTSHGWTNLAPNSNRAAYLKVQRFGYADSDTVYCEETSPSATTAATTAAPTNATTGVTTEAPTSATNPPTPGCVCCVGTAVTEYRCIYPPQGLIQQQRNGVAYDGSCGASGSSGTGCSGACTGCSCPAFTDWGDWFNIIEGMCF